MYSFITIIFSYFEVASRNHFLSPALLSIFMESLAVDKSIGACLIKLRPFSKADNLTLFSFHFAGIKIEQVVKNFEIIVSIFKNSDWLIRAVRKNHQSL